VATTLCERQSNRIRRFASRGLFGPIEKTAIIKWAENDVDFLHSFNLLYERYLKLNYIQERKSFPYYYNTHSLLPQTKKAIFVRNNVVFSTVDIVKDTKSFGLPMDEIYHDELNDLRAQGRKLCEVGSLACSHDANWQNTFMPLFRVIFWHALNNGMNDICITVNPKHVAFYKSILVFQNLGEEKFYPYVNAPAIALRMNLDHCKQTVRNAYRGFLAEDSLYSYIWEWELTATARESTMIVSNPLIHIGKKLLSSLVQKNEGIRNIWAGYRTASTAEIRFSG
jgi:hypothetical protein